MYFRADLHQFLEIDNLVVTPVADVCPGVMWFGEFPIDPLTRNSIRVIPICRSRIQKSADHAFDIFRIGIGESLPILEDITPVAFVAQFQRSIRFLDIDHKTIPWSAGIAMPATECQR